MYVQEPPYYDCERSEIYSERLARSWFLCQPISSLLLSGRLISVLPFSVPPGDYRVIQETLY